MAERTAAYEGRPWSDLPWRVKARFWRSYLAYGRRLWQRWTVLPGDVIVDPVRDIYYVVHSGRPGHVKAYVISGQLAVAYRIVAQVPPRRALDFTDLIAAALADPGCVDVAPQAVTLP